MFLLRKGIIFLDKAHFHASGAVNKQNLRYWSEDRNRELHHRPLHSQFITVVYCSVLDPYIFFFSYDSVTAMII